jgi:hypothetical protein
MKGHALKLVHALFTAGYCAVILLFVCGAFGLIFFGAVELWNGLVPSGDAPLRGRFNSILEAIGLLTIAVAALELGQTVLEEEVQRSAHMSAPTRVRRFLSRFMVVIIVSLSIEALVSVFQFVHEDPSQLVQAAAIGVAAAALLAAWGVFVTLNRTAEELEPEAMQKAKSEDREVEKEK